MPDLTIEVAQPRNRREQRLLARAIKQGAKIMTTDTTEIPVIHGHGHGAAHVYDNPATTEPDNAAPVVGADTPAVPHIEETKVSAVLSESEYALILAQRHGTPVVTPTHKSPALAAKKVAYAVPRAAAYMGGLLGRGVVIGARAVGHGAAVIAKPVVESARKGYTGQG